MLAFSSARRAVTCAQAMQREIPRIFVDDSPPIRVRIGIHTGDAIHETDRFFGATVHYAARVVSQALGGKSSSRTSSSSSSRTRGSSSPRAARLSSRVSTGRHRLFAVDLSER